MDITKALEIITGKVDRVLLEKGYEKHSVADTDNEKTVLYTGETAYSVVYYVDKKRVVLRSCSVTGGEPDNNWKTVATWLFDEEVDGQREAENIGSDFAETISGPKQAAVQAKRRAKRENGEQNSDPLFFANRMIAYFPELRDEVAFEKAHYTNFRGITFADEKILPRFQEYVKSEGASNLKKLSKALNDLYEAGDLDVKGIITYILLNGIDDDEKYQEMTSEFVKENKKVADAARNLRGKKMKPEKPKKPKKYMAEALNRANQ